MAKIQELADFTRIGNKEVGEALGEWFLKQGDETLFTHGEIAGVIKKIRLDLTGDRNFEINNYRLKNAIAVARDWLEREKKKTIISVIRRGYKLATTREASIFAAYDYKATARKVSRFMEQRLGLLKGKYLPEALAKAFERDRSFLEKLVAGSRYQIEFDELKKHKAMPKARQLQNN